MLRLLGPTALFVLAIACSSGATSDAAVLVSLTDSIIVPGYEAVAQEASGLRQALDGLCAGPSDMVLSEAQQAWRDVRAPWMRSEATWFGPVMDRRSVSAMDWPEVRPERIEGMLADSPVTTEDDVRNRLASTQRGLGTIEYLLFDPDALGLLSGPSSTRCDYLTALGRVVESESNALVAAWTAGDGGGPAYGDFLTGRSDSSLLAGQAVAELVRTQVFLTRTIVDMRLASALGLREGGPDLRAIPGGKGHNALTDLRNEVLGMRDIYIGHEETGGLGISELVRELSTETDERMRGHFESAVAAIDAVGMPLRPAIHEQPEKVRPVYDRLLDLQRTLSTEVVSLLGVSVGFGDTDGDSLR